MDSRNSRSRSKTPFTQMEFPTEDLTEKLIHSEKTTIRTTRRTALRLGETIAASAENVSLKMEKPLRKSTRSERTVHKWHKTSDYSSEDGENEVSSAQTMTQNEKNQLVEDARAAANGTDEVSALNLYKKSGRYWDVYPKTDWTYSPHSKDRIELAPGVVAMPNMSRKTIHSVHTTDSSYDFAHKETNTEAVSRWNVAQSYAEYMPRKLFNNNYDDEYRSEKNTSFIRNQWIKLKRSLTSVFISVVTILYFIFEVQTYWFAKLHTFTSRVMLLDTWLLLKNGVGNKTRKLTALCLVPLILLGGCCILTNLGSFLYGAYFNSTLNILPESENMMQHHVISVPFSKDEGNIGIKGTEQIVENKVLKVTDENYMAPPTADEIASNLSEEQLHFISQSIKNSQSDNEKYSLEEIVANIIKSSDFQNVVYKLQDNTFQVDNKNLLRDQKLIIDNLQNEMYKLRQQMLEMEKKGEKHLHEVIHQLKSENIHNSARLNYNLNRCCRKPIIDIDIYIKRTLSNLFNDTNFFKNQRGFTEYFNSIYAARQDLETQLLNLTSSLNSKFTSLIEDNSLGLLDTISEKIKEEINKKIQTGTNTGYHRTETGISEEHVKKIVKDALTIYDADKTGLVDYAIETMGGQILTTRCTENYHYGKAVVSVLGIPLWYPVNSPRTIITSSINPGECWAFQNFPGFVVIRLSKRIKVEAFSLEHISKLLVPNGEIDSAPKQFEVYGLTEENDKEPFKLGEYVYKYDGEPLQFFKVQSEGHSFEIIELRILSNYGNPNYTCLYRFRVHGKSNP